MPRERAEVKPWLVKASHDWSAVKKIMATPDPELDIAGFHCQQAIEKTLKAFLVHHEAAFEKIHDLRKLLNQCAAIDASFSALRGQVEPLTIFAVAFRYPSPSEPALEEIIESMEIVEEVWRFVIKRLPKHVIP